MVFTGPNLPHLWRSDSEYYEGNKKLQTRGLVIYFQESFLGKSFLETEEAIRIKQLFQKAYRGLEVTGKTARQLTKMMKDLLDLKGFDRFLQLLHILNVLANSVDYHLLASAGYRNSLKASDKLRFFFIYVKKQSGVDKKECV